MPPHKELEREKTRQLQASVASSVALRVECLLDRGLPADAQKVAPIRIQFSSGRWGIVSSAGHGDHGSVRWHELTLVCERVVLAWRTLAQTELDGNVVLDIRPTGKEIEGSPVYEWMGVGSCEGELHKADGYVIEMSNSLLCASSPVTLREHAGIFRRIVGETEWFGRTLEVVRVNGSRREWFDFCSVRVGRQDEEWVLELYGSKMIAPERDRRRQVSCPARILVRRQNDQWIEVARNNGGNASSGNRGATGLISPSSTRREPVIWKVLH